MQESSMVPPESESDWGKRSRARRAGPRHTTGEHDADSRFKIQDSRPDRDLQGLTPPWDTIPHNRTPCGVSTSALFCA